MQSPQNLGHYGLSQTLALMGMRRAREDDDARSRYVVEVARREGDNVPTFLRNCHYIEISPIKRRTLDVLVPRTRRICPFVGLPWVERTP